MADDNKVLDLSELAPQVKPFDLNGTRYEVNLRVPPSTIKRIMRWMNAYASEADYPTLDSDLWELTSQVVVGITPQDAEETFGMYACFAVLNFFSGPLTKTTALMS